MRNLSVLSVKCCFVCLTVLAAPALALAQEPAITGTSVGAVAPGAVTSLEIRGSNLAGAKTLWTSFPAQVVLNDAKDNGTKADRVTFDVTVSSDAVPGIHAVRVLTETGVSPLRFLLVDTLPPVAFDGKATSMETAQALTVPAAVDGAVANLGTHYFKFQAEEGQRLSFEVLARRIGNSLDPMIRLLDASGRELAFNDDAPGQSGDSQICHTFASAGEYLLELRDVRYQGGGYRLRIGDFPCVSVAYPLAAQRGQTATVHLAGLSVEGLVPVEVAVPGDPHIAWLPVASIREQGSASGFSTLEVVDRPQFLEAEPNNTAETANRIELTHDVNGRLDQPGDVDRFVFAAKKDESYTFTGVTRTQGSPADLLITILKSDGGQLAQVDDTGTDEGTVTVKFPADGDYQLLVHDLSRRGGSDYAYRIAITPTTPRFSLAVSTDTFNVPAKGSAFATVTSKREGYNGPIELSVEGLPNGVTASRSVIGAGRNDAVLTLTSAGEISAGELSLIRVVGTGNNGALRSVADFSGAMKTKFAGLRYLPGHLSTDLASAAAKPAEFRWRAEPEEVVFGKQLSTKVKLVADRDDGFDDVVTVALQPAQNGVPAGVTVAVKNIDKAKNEVELTISADDKAALGDFTVGLLGTLKKDKITAVQPLALRLSLQPPLTLSANLGEGKLAAGQPLEVTVDVVRNPAATGPVELSFLNLPKGVTASAATLTAEESSVKVTLTAAEDAAKGEVKNLQVKSVVTVGNAKLEATSPNLTLTVE